MVLGLAYIFWEQNELLMLYMRIEKWVHCNNTIFLDYLRQMEKIYVVCKNCDESLFNKKKLTSLASKL